MVEFVKNVQKWWETFFLKNALFQTLVSHDLQWHIDQTFL